MTMDQAAFFLAGSIMVALGFIIICAGFITVNNLLNRYWKPVQLFKWLDYKETQQYLTHEELEKMVDKIVEKRKDKNE